MISVRPGYATPRSVCKRECTCLCLNRALVYCKDRLLLTVPLSHLPLSDQSCCFAHHAATGCTYQPSCVLSSSSGMLPRACQSCQTSSCLLVVDHASYNIRTWPWQSVCIYVVLVTGTQNASSYRKGCCFCSMLSFHLLIPEPELLKVSRHQAAIVLQSSLHHACSYLILLSGVQACMPMSHCRRYVCRM